MTRDDLTRITELLIEVGGHRSWVLIWDSSDDEAETAGVLASVPPAELPELVCAHLLRLLRGEPGEPDTLVREH